MKENCRATGQTLRFIEYQMIIKKLKVYKLCGKLSNMPINTRLSLKTKIA